VRHVYIYYRIDLTQEKTAARAVDALLAQLAAYCSTPPQRLARCDDPALWMEVYPGISNPAAFADALDAAVNNLPVRSGMIGTRRQETFCPPPAARQART
jgi:hypothetical protein